MVTGISCFGESFPSRKISGSRGSDLESRGSKTFRCLGHAEADADAVGDADADRCRGRCSSLGDARVFATISSSDISPPSGEIVSSISSSSSVETWGSTFQL